jgi:hypothetical protein
LNGKRENMRLKTWLPLHDPNTMEALRNCGLLKFFKTQEHEEESASFGAFDKDVG